MIKDPAHLEAIRLWAPKLRAPDTLVKPAVLAAITYPETRWAARWEASNDEKAYKPGGAYYRRHVPTLYERFGDAAASSWSAWQILFITAHEMGFNGRPWELVDPLIACQYVVRTLNKRCFNTWEGAPKEELKAPADTIEEVGDMWNSGSFRDNIPPLAKYLPEITCAYDEAVEFYQQAEKPPGRT